MKFTRQLLLTILLLSAVCLRGTAETPPDIVSLSPALTELLCFLGGGDRLAGRSGGCNYPDSVKDLPVIGALATPDLERVARSGAKLLLADNLRHAGIRKSLTGMGVEVLPLPLVRLPDYPAAVTALGNRIGAADRAAAEVERFNRFVTERRRNRPDHALKVLFVVWHDPVIAAGGNTFAGDYIELAGGWSVSAGIKREYFRPSPEWVVRHDPDLIIYPGGHGVAAGALPAYWQDLRAVRNGDLYRPEDADLYFRLSPRFDRAVTGLEKILQTCRQRRAAAASDQTKPDTEP